MPEPPQRVFLDTNVYLIGMAYLESPESEILRWVGFGQKEPGPVEVIVSGEVFDQIKRVARRLRSKDWAGEILGHIWQDLQIRYVLLDSQEIAALESLEAIPREDVGIYLTARDGNVQCFVSSNRELIAALAQKTGEFECLAPEQFVEKYLR
ncbi:MAG: hypothetical protein P8Z00_17635 [Anaerolineales bacterium]